MCAIVVKNDNAIFFFSGTGNSFYIALRLAEKMQNIDVYNIACINEMPTADYKRVGFVFPVYGFTMPNIVERFLSDYQFDKDTYYFSVLTMGGFAFGAKYRICMTVKNAKGHLNYIDIVYMPQNYILFSKVPSDKIIDEHLHNAIKRVEDLCSDILTYKDKRAIKPLTYYFTRKTAKTEQEKFKDTAKSFVVNDDCIKCGLCVNLCPVDNISMDEDKIIFSNHCECCLCCIHACPAEAINYLDKTAGKKRYLNPNISIGDMKKYCGDYRLESSTNPSLRNK